MAFISFSTIGFLPHFVVVVEGLLAERQQAPLQVEPDNQLAVKDLRELNHLSQMALDEFRIFADSDGALSKCIKETSTLHARIARRVDEIHAEEADALGVQLAAASFADRGAAGKPALNSGLLTRQL